MELAEFGTPRAKMFHISCNGVHLFTIIPRTKNQNSRACAGLIVHVPCYGYSPMASVSKNRLLSWLREIGIENVSSLEKELSLHGWTTKKEE